MQWHADGRRLLWVERIGDVDGVWARAFDAPEGTKPEPIASAFDLAAAVGLPKLACNPETTVRATVSLSGSTCRRLPTRSPR
jgi:hypothetical protein